MMIAGAMPPAAHIVTRRTLEIAPLEFVENRTDEHRAGGADRMTERDRAAVRIDLLAIEIAGRE